VLNKRKKDELHFSVSVPTLISLVALVVVLLVAWKLFDNPNNLTTDNTSKTTVEENILKGDSSDYLDIEATDSNSKSIVEAVSKHILLPKGNIEIHTIKDIDLLREKGPTLFQFAKNGDKMLVSKNRIIIFDPELDKVVDVIRPQ